MKSNIAINEVKRFFKDKNGDWAVAQFPNVLLLVWMILAILIWLMGSTTFVAGLRLLQSTVLFSWAYLELTSGASYFRKALGAVVMAAVVAGYFL